MNGITILNQANAPMGPFTREQVVEKLRRGEVSPSSLAFVEGLTQWTPLREVLARTEAALPALPAVPAPAPAPVLTAPIVPIPSYSYAATMAPPSHLVYAGFWLRFVATLIDLVILFAIYAVLLIVWCVIFSLLVGTKNLSFNPPSSSPPVDAVTFLLMAIMEFVLIIAVLLVAWLYHALFESSAWQGTLGKRVLNLRVTSMSGERISFWHATGRFCARTVAALPFCVGYIMAAFTERKQALHDMVAGTLVVRH